MAKTFAAVVVSLALALGCSTGTPATRDDAIGVDQTAAGSGGASGTTAGTGGSGGTPVPPTAGTGGTTCARLSVATMRVIPRVELVVDASGSMVEPFAGCSSRWECLRDALIGPTGLVTQLEGTVQFGLTLYAGQIATVRDGVVVEVQDATCPRMLHVDAALDNRDAIAMPYERANPAGGTPTAEALTPVIDALPDRALLVDQELGPQIILLVTDGDPNACGDPVTTDYAPSEQQAQRAHDKHVELFVIALADDQNRMHLQRTANLGVGMPADTSPGAPFWQPSDSADLAQTLLQIVKGAVGCEVKLHGEVQPGDECEGHVMLDGQPLECNGPDGWRLLDPGTIELVGGACEQFEIDPSAVLSADFPCDLIIVD